MGIPGCRSFCFTQSKDNFLTRQVLFVDFLTLIPFRVWKRAVKISAEITVENSFLVSWDEDFLGCSRSFKTANAFVLNHGDQVLCPYCGQETTPEFTGTKSRLFVRNFVEDMPDRSLLRRRSALGRASTIAEGRLLSAVCQKGQSACSLARSSSTPLTACCNPPPPTQKREKGSVVDWSYPFRQDPNFFYLTGFDERDAFAVIGRTAAWAYWQV